jgi:hypothetical protein
MTVKSDVNTALSAVLANTYAIELPSEPTWPAIVYEIDTERETGWVLGAEYEQHVIAVTLLSDSLAEVATLKDQVETAMRALDGYMGLEDHGDAEYEDDARIYGYFMNYRIRTRELT